MKVLKPRVKIRPTRVRELEDEAKKAAQATTLIQIPAASTIF